jgi:MtN3 and saliva related transmembrane protein
MAEYLGYIAGVLTTVCYVPQIVRVFRLRSAREISLPFTVLLLTGVAAWLCYGVLLGLFPMVLWNSIGVIIVATLLYAKLKYGR